MHIALITAKGGNTTLKNKNIQMIGGKPSVMWSIIAAQEAKLIDEIFLSTECPHIAEVGKSANVHIIDRPTDLSKPTSNHGDVIVHGAYAAADILGEHPETITILLGNTVMTIGEDIDETIRMTCSEPFIDSSMTVWKAQDDHPYRAMIVENGFLRSFNEDLKADTNRQSYPDVVFYDQGPWTVKMTTLSRCMSTKEGPGPWWWMGRNCVPIERLWVTGRDTHSQFDVDIAEWWLNKFRKSGRRNPRSI